MSDTKQHTVEQAESAVETESFHLYLRQRVREALYEVVEAEVSGLCGRRHHPVQGNRYSRGGSAPSSVYLDGRREKLLRPRVRDDDGEGGSEVELKSWQMARDPGQWEEAMYRAVLCGVSTRKVAQLRPSALLGESKSSLSRLWQRKARELVEQLQYEDLSEADPLVLMIDAVVLCKGLVATVAMQIDTSGNKRILGYRVGNSENQQVCEDLLGSLERRGLNVPVGRRLLAVLDGSQSLSNALLKYFPGALVQRCLVHKERNLRGYLSARHWKELAALFNRLRRSQGPEQAAEVAGVIKVFLKDKNAQARASFEEAGGDLLTLLDLDVPNTLNTSLLSTNSIENAFKNLRRHIGRVCRWRGETEMADLWLTSGLTLAQSTFRKIKGFNELPDLIKSLERSEMARLAA